MASRRGRPRSEAVRGAILTAAAELATEGGPGAATIDAIARRAEVSRTTIYKWWPSAAAIVLEGLLESVRESIVRPPGSSTVEALVHHVSALNAILTEPGIGALLRNVIAAAAGDRAIQAALLTQWIEPRRGAMVNALTDAVVAGELSEDTDIEVIVDALVSPPYYRLVFGMPPLSERQVRALVDAVWTGCS